MIKSLKNMYSSVKARIKVDHMLYKWVTKCGGTNQGLPLSPNMFCRMLHDMIKYLEIEEGIPSNENEIIPRILWMDDFILMSNSSRG